jgi:hypothetical protein
MDGSHSTGNRQGAVHASRRNLHRRSSSLLQLLSSVTTRVSRLTIVTQQVKRKGNGIQALNKTKVNCRKHPTPSVYLL